MVACQRPDSTRPRRNSPAGRSALKATTAEVRHKILDLLPAQFAERLRHAVAHLGVVPRAIAEQSRHTIAGTLRRLQSEGKIRIEPVPPSRLVA